MSEPAPNRITVMRSLTRKRGDEYEKVLVGAEANLASGVTLEEALADLNQTVTLALRKATETTTPPEPLPASPTIEAAPSRSSREVPPSVIQEVGAIHSVDGKKKLAMAYADKTSLRVSIDPSVELSAVAPPLTNFLQTRVLDAMITVDKERKASAPISYEIKTTQDKQRLLEIHVHNITDERRRREVTNAIQWTLRRLAEKR